MRILHTISSAAPEGGGPIEATRLSVLAMKELGHETEIVTLDDPDGPDFPQFACPVHRVGRWTRRYGYTPRLAQWIEDNAGRFDAAVLHGLWNHSSVGAWHGLRRAGLPYVTYIHGMMDPWFRRTYPLKHCAKQAFWWLWQGKVLRDAHAVLFTCEEERKLARGVFLGPSYNERVVAYGGSSPPRQDDDGSAFRLLVPDLGNRPYLLFLSRIHPKKGCDLLVKAFARIAADFPDLGLVIAGPDRVGLRTELERLAREAGIEARIHWPGMVSGPAKAGAFRHAEAMILPSHQENFGIVVAEALAHARPVLISTCVNIWREVEAAGAGLVAEDTLEGTESMMRRFLALSPDERDGMGAAGLALYRRQFTPEAAARDLEKALFSAIAAHAN